MYTDHFYYYQPEQYSDDGTNIEYGGLPVGLHSFQAFRSEADCREWLEDNDYNPGDFIIRKYQDDDIEDVTILDYRGEIVDRVEDVLDDELADHIIDIVIMNAGSMDNLKTLKQDDESEQEYEDRVYTDALEMVHDAITEIEEEGDFNFQSYIGTPEEEWYDEAREIALIEIMGYMTGDEEE